MKFGTRFAILAAFAALAVGLFAGTAAAATATLSITTGCVDNSGRNYAYMLRVEGVTRYNPSEMRVEVRLWGDDQWSDDFLSGPYVYTSEETGGYSLLICVNGSTLNEDWGQDEIYASIRVYDPWTGRQFDSGESNRIHGYF
jgi:hypothetical protein